MMSDDDDDELIIMSTRLLLLLLTSFKRFLPFIIRCLMCCCSCLFLFDETLLERPAGRPYIHQHSSAKKKRAARDCHPCQGLSLVVLPSSRLDFIPSVNKEKGQHQQQSLFAPKHSTSCVQQAKTSQRISQFFYLFYLEKKREISQ